MAAKKPNHGSTWTPPLIHLSVKVQYQDKFTVLL